MSVLQRLGFSCAELDEPYAAMTELAKRPMVYRALVLSLASVYREELQMIATVKRKFRHIDVWLTQADGRLNALTEALRYGADGLLTDDGLHPTSSINPDTGATAGDVSTLAPNSITSGPFSPVPIHGSEPTGEYDVDLDPAPGEPVLTADELRALLQEQPASLPYSTGEGA